MKRPSHLDQIENIWAILTPPKNLSPFQRETWLFNEVKVTRLKAGICWKEQDKSLITPETIEKYDVFCISTLFEIYAVLTEDNSLFLICCDGSPEFRGILDIVKTADRFSCTVFTFENKRYILDDVKVNST